MPEAYGGVDLDKISTLIVSEQLSRYASFGATFGAQANLTILPIYMFGTEAQKQTVPARPDRRRDGRRLLPQRVRLGLGRARRQGEGDNAGGRQLRALGREDVDHQRRLRRPVHRLRQGGRRTLHRLHRRKGWTGVSSRQGGAQDGPPRLVDDSGDPAGRQGACRRRARRDRQGPQGGVQRAQLRALQARRDGVRRRQGLAGRGGEVRRHAQAVQRARSARSGPSSTSWAR